MLNRLRIRILLWLALIISVLGVLYCPDGRCKWLAEIEFNRRRLAGMSQPRRLLSSFLAPVIALIVAFGVLGFSGCLPRTFKQGYEKGKKEANEEHLRTELATMREAIQKFTKEKGTPPISLDELVYAQYLSMIPRDPVTKKIDWVPVFYDCSHSKDCINGIKDVHSSSEELSSLGTAYSTW